MSVTHARGFRAAGIAAGSKPSGLPDLGVLVGDPGTNAAGLFTTNRVAAAPVTLSRQRLAHGAPRAVLVNSGQANAATGERGAHDALRSAAAAEATLGLATGDLLPCSTGVIGEPLHMDELLGGLPGLADALSPDGGDAFARAIMTTDTVDKQAVADGATFRVGGCAKGVGMISPNLATMLAFVTTDALLVSADLQRLADETLKPRFNALTVDGCTSTNDTVLLFASGAAGGQPVTPGSSMWDETREAVGAVADALRLALAADAEGGTHVLVVDVIGAPSEAAARAVAKAVANSSLVKTAAFGGDPNPGRILQAVGAAGVDLDPGAIDVTIGGCTVASAGVIPPAYFEDGPAATQARDRMTAREIAIGVALGAGPGRSRAVGCDLSYEYVRINGEYTT
jgi:glutamate N-acetyltransferase / amino-acid N-acetyltransferase